MTRARRHRQHHAARLHYPCQLLRLARCINAQDRIQRPIGERQTVTGSDAERDRRITFSGVADRHLGDIQPIDRHIALLGQPGGHRGSVIPFPTAYVQQRASIGRQRQTQPLGHLLLQRLIISTVEKRSPRLHHFRAVSRLLRSLVLYRQQIDVALFGLIELMIAVTTPVL